MRALATRSQRLALGVAVLTAAALGTVSATAAQTSGTSTAKSHETVVSGVSVVQEKGKGKHTAPPKGTGFAVAYKPTANAPDDLNAANDDFAACMREQGRSTFPDFHATKDDEGHVLLNVKVTGGDFDPTSSGYKKALKACGSILEKVGITFPNPADLPPLPRPGEGPESGTTQHIRPGEPGTPGKSGAPELPSLTSSIGIENA
ncbi:hypothetical protein [Streptomyces sp. R41]|uniref:Secreted protein n=1 Tax=Streptomyces sp. R41 TaxID=3238632 RepID=A0AB39RQR7_9ACTN